MRFNLFLLVVMAMLLVSCGGNKSGQLDSDAVADSLVSDSLKTDSLAAELEDIPMPKAADELFDDFLFNFVANRKLQIERVRFPLPIITGGKTERVERNKWKPEHFFMRQGYYTLLFDNERQMEIVKDTSVHHAVVEKIYFNSQSIQQYIFDRMRGTWMLTSIHVIPIQNDVNASFLTFYHKFATDKEFQNKSLGETVHFVGPDPDDDFKQMEGIITPDTWEAFAPELPSKMIYNIIYGHPKHEGNSKIFVLRGIANGFELEMTFYRKKNNWKLVKLTT